MNFSAITNFLSLWIEYISISLFCKNDFIDLLLSTHLLFGLQLYWFKFFPKELAIVAPFLSFKGIIYASLLWISITQNKNLNPSLNLLNNCISAKSALQILSRKSECTFLFSNVLIIGLCNSSAKTLLAIISFLNVQPEVL